MTEALLKTPFSETDRFSAGTGRFCPLCGLELVYIPEFSEEKRQKAEDRYWKFVKERGIDEVEAFDYIQLVDCKECGGLVHEHCHLVKHQEI